MQESVVRVVEGHGDGAAHDRAEVGRAREAPALGEHDEAGEAAEGGRLRESSFNLDKKNPINWCWNVYRFVCDRKYHILYRT